MKVSQLWVKPQDFSFEQVLLNMSEIVQHIHKRKGWVYIAMNPRYPYLKIGRTSKTPFERAKTLSSSGVLDDFEVVFALPTFDSVLLEAMVHRELKKYRIKKEFFAITQELAQSTISQMIEKTNQNFGCFFDLELIQEDLSLMEAAFMKKRNNYEKSHIYKKSVIK